jgi:hypothetical protein
MKGTIALTEIRRRSFWVSICEGFPGSGWVMPGWDWTEFP